MSKFKLVMLFLIPAFFALVITASSNPPMPPPDQYNPMPPLPPVNYPPPPVKPNPQYPEEKVKIPSWDSLSINSEHMSLIGKTSELSETILITKITPSNGEINLNNTNNTMPMNVSGWHLGILSIDHPKKEVIANGSVISPMGQLVIRISSLDNSGVASLADSTGKIVDRVSYAGNWTKAIKS